MSVQPMPRSLQARYMRAFIDETFESGKRTFDVKPKFPGALDSDDLFPHHLRILEGMGLISVYWIYGGTTPLQITVTIKGISFFEQRAEERRQLVINSIILPILIAIITTTVTVYILPSLGQSAKQWLAQAPQDTPELPESPELANSLQADQTLPTPATSENPAVPS